MPPKAPKDRLIEEEDRPPNNDPHHRTTRPSISSIRAGSTVGMDAVPVALKRSSSERPRAIRPLSPHPNIRQLAPTNPGLLHTHSEQRSRDTTRTLRPFDNRNPRAPTPGHKYQNQRISPSREHVTRRNRRRVVSQPSALAQLPIPFDSAQRQRAMEPTLPVMPVTSNFGMQPTFYPQPTWPEIIETQDPPSNHRASVAPEDNHNIGHRRRYLGYYKEILSINALHSLLSEQVTPLNPVLSAPPVPYHWFGTRICNWMERSNWMLKVRAKRNALPGLEWDVRTRPEDVIINAWPYANFVGVGGEEGGFMSRKQLRTRSPVDEMEVRRFCGQTVTNPPSTVMSILVTEEWGILVRSAIPGRWVCVRDVIAAVYNALNEPIHILDRPPESMIWVRRNSSGQFSVVTIPAPETTPVTRLSTLKGGRYIWTGLRNAQSEMIRTTPVRELVNGDIDGGTWRLVLRKP